MTTPCERESRPTDLVRRVSYMSLQNINGFSKIFFDNNINVRKLIGQVTDQIKLRGTKIENLAERVKSMGEKVGSMDDNIKKLELKKSMGP